MALIHIKIFYLCYQILPAFSITFEMYYVKFKPLFSNYVPLWFMPWEY